jgi:tetratricopeptide (TPR) repeat protein
VNLHDVHRRADVAIRLGAASYAFELCTHIRRLFPSDLRTHLLLGQSCLELGRLEEACRAFDVVLAADPENVAALTGDGVAHSGLGQLQEALRSFEHAYELQPGNMQVRESLARLYAEGAMLQRQPDPSPPVAVARWLLRHGDLDDALARANRLLLDRPGDLLLLLAYAEALWRAGRYDRAEASCRQLLARSPRLLKPRLILGQIMAADRAREAQGVELLHRAMVEDPSGMIAEPLFQGTSFACPILARALPVDLPASLIEPPARLAEALAVLPTIPPDSPDIEWIPPEFENQHGASRPIILDSRAVPEDDEEKDVDTELEAVSAIDAESPRLAHGILVVSCRTPWIERYGTDAWERLERRLETAQRELVAHQTGLIPVFVDDARSTARFGARPVAPSEPHSIKAAIDEVLQYLTDHGQPIDALLILGGDEIVPFFRVPDPADDDDGEILTDAPYGVLAGDSVFTPSLPTGRFPAGAAANPGLIFRQIDTMIESRRIALPAADGPGLLRAALSSLGLGLPHPRSLGYGAQSVLAALDEAAAPLGTGLLRRASPPARASAFDARWITGRRLLYFNLLGSPVTDAWYGETAPGAAGRDDLPVALTADLLSIADANAPIVLTLAGHAANVIGRSPGNNLVLRFLHEGAVAVVGATGTCYGTVDRPLVGADLLARYFWLHLSRGDAVGAALQHARRDYVHLVSEAQGYLDGDDQKTLLEFIVLGDPLGRAFARSSLACDGDQVGPLPPCLCNQREPADPLRLVEPEALKTALECMADFYPTVVDGKIRVLRRYPCDGLCRNQAHAGCAANGDLQAVVTITARKDLPTIDGTTLTRIARLTLDRQGDVLKGVISR